jgi:hypothetical protein
MTRSHLQVLQPFRVGFGVALFPGCQAMDVEKYGHVKVLVVNHVESTTRKAGGDDGALRT